MDNRVNTFCDGQPEPAEGPGTFSSLRVARLKGCAQADDIDRGCHHQEGSSAFGNLFIRKLGLVATPRTTATGYTSPSVRQIQTARRVER